MKRIRVPEGMLKAALDEWRGCVTAIELNQATAKEK